MPDLQDPRLLANVLLLGFVASPIAPGFAREMCKGDEAAIVAIRRAGLDLIPGGFEPWECTFADGCVEASRYHHWTAANALFESAVLNSQGEAKYYWWHTALLASMGRITEATTILDAAYRHFGRTNIAIRTDLAFLLIVSKRYSEAEEILSATLDFVPAHNPVVMFHFCLLYEAQDRMTEAANVAVQFMTHAAEQFQANQGRPVGQARLDWHMMLLGMCSFLAGRAGAPQVADWTLALLLKYKETSERTSSLELAMALIGHGRFDEAVASLERAAFEEADPYSMWFHILPPLRHLHDHKGYRSLLAKLKLPLGLYA